MLDLKNNLLKDSMAQIIKEQFNYTEEVETKSGHDRPDKVNSGSNHAWQPFAALFKIRKLPAPKQS